MNFYGISDIRIVNLSNALASLGFYVITPEIPQIKKMIINLDTLESLSRFLNIFNSHYSYDRVNIFLISFSGGLTLIPLSNVQNNIYSSIMSIGAYSDFELTIPYVVSNFNYDNYGTYILFYNYIDTIVKNKNIKNYFYNCIIYNSMGIYDTEYFKAKQNLSKTEISFIRKMENSLDFRLELAENIIKDKKDLIKKLSPINYLDNFNASSNTLFLHGHKDKIISKDESTALHKKIKKSKLLITDLISHGDTHFSINKLLEVIDLIKIFSYYFNSY